MRRLTRIEWFERNTLAEGERESVNRGALGRMFPDWTAEPTRPHVRGSVKVSRRPGAVRPRVRHDVIGGCIPWL